MGIQFLPFGRAIPTPDTLLRAFDGGITLAAPPVFIVQADKPDAYRIELALLRDTTGTSFSTVADDLVFDDLTLTPMSVGEIQADNFYGGVWQPTDEVLKRWTKMLSNAAKGQWRFFYRLGPRVGGPPERRTGYPRGDQAGGYDIIGKSFDRYAWLPFGKPASAMSALLNTTSVAGNAPVLTVLGGRLMAGDQPAFLRGVNFSGLQHQHPYGITYIPDAKKPNPIPAWRETTGFTSDLFDLVAAGGVNIVPLCLNQQFLLDEVIAANMPAPRGKVSATVPSYLAAIDEVVTGLEQRGIYVILCLQCLYMYQTNEKWPKSCVAKNSTAPHPPITFTPLIPDTMSPVFWEVLRRRYAGHGTLLFDVLNEPHLPDVSQQVDEAFAVTVFRDRDSIFCKQDVASDTRLRTQPVPKALPASKPNEPDQAKKAQQDKAALDDRTSQNIFWREEWKSWVRLFHLQIHGGEEANLLPTAKNTGLVRLETPSPAGPLLVVGGMNWGAVLDGMAVSASAAQQSKADPKGKNDLLEGIVYASHMYAYSGTDDTLRTRLLGDGVSPIIIGEWGAFADDSIILTDIFKPMNSTDRAAFVACFQKDSTGDYANNPTGSASASKSDSSKDSRDAVLRVWVKKVLVLAEGGR